MRTKKRAVLFLIVTVLVLVATVTTAQARAVFTEFTGTEWCEPVEMGEWTYHDGNIHVRGMVLACWEDTTDPRMAGSNTVIMNANWQADPNAMMGGTGPMWGTWQMQSWSGTWEGTMLADGGVYHAQGKGFGECAGLKVWLDSDHGNVSGRILDPHGD